ncbi:MAG TPA: M3 family metallopeptidase [Steroidobacteraceae bacterium]|nr:M3 family metallopeptidase [Steroidobacteraceae bacterium]
MTDRPPEPLATRQQSARSVMLGAASVLLACALAIEPGDAQAVSAAAADPPQPGAGIPTLWDLRDLYRSPQAWSASYAKTKAAAEALERYRGSLGSSAGAMLRALDALSAVEEESDRLGVYASLKGDEDLRIATNQERRQQAQALVTLIAEKSAWLAPEIIALGSAKVRTFETESPELTHRFDFLLHDTLRAAPHTLGVQAEGVLAAAGDVLAQPTAIHDQLMNADMPYPQFILADGKRIRLDEPAYEKYRQSGDRALRKRVFDAFFGTLARFQGTAGATLTSQVMGDVFTARTRRYDSALAAALFQSNMPEAVYRTLVAQTNAALAPMGPRYLALLRKGFAGAWMNVLPHPGKATGGYMNGSAYGVHPYLLLNHNGDYESLSTFAHEWGHAVHTLLADAAQPYEKSNYPTFIAESASIANEMLINDYMVAHARSQAGGFITWARDSSRSAPRFSARSCSRSSSSRSTRRSSTVTRSRARGSPRCTAGSCSATTGRRRA